MESLGVTLPTVKLNGKNYYDWVSHVEITLTLQNCYDIVTGSEQRPTNPGKDQDNWDKRDKRAAALIKLTLSEEVFPEVRNERSGIKVWEILKDLYQNSGDVWILSLTTELYNMKLSSSQEIVSHLSKLKEKKNELASLGKDIDDRDFVQIILQSLPGTYQSFIRGLDTADKLKSIKSEELCAKLVQEEKRQAKEKESFDGESQAFVMKGKQYYKKSQDNQSKERNWKNENKSVSYIDHNRSKWKCHYCGKMGHKANECFKKKRDTEKKTNNSPKFDDSKRNAFCVALKENNTFKDDWVIDSGATQHMSHNENQFESISENNIEKIYLGDNSALEVKGTGNIKVDNGLFKNVKLVPELKRNLLSVSQITSQGHKIEFYSDKCLIKDVNDNYRVIEIGKMENGLYKFQEFTSKCGDKHMCAIVQYDDMSRLWHERLGHVNFQSLKLMERLQMVHGLPKISLSPKVCEGCAMRKHVESFPQGKSWRAKTPLHLVHSDVMGPFKTPSIGGSRYALTFIDDYSRRIWVYFLQKKDEVFQKFKEFKALTEKQSGKYLKILRTDRGTEYMNKAFLDFCKEHGIKKESTVSYSPQQNGVAERKNRTIIEMARCMLHSRNLEAKFWAEAVHTAVYILNRTPTKAVLNITPEEAWSGRKPTVSHFRIFGCKAYAHIPDERRSKLERKSEKCIMVGYSEESKGYRLYNPRTNEIYIKRNVWFDEDIKNDNSPTLSFFPILIDEENSTSTKDQSQGVQTTWEETQVEESSESDNENPKKFRSIQEIYQEGPRNIFANYALMTKVMQVDTPSTYEEAKGKDEWEVAMQEEYNSLIKNGTWELTTLPEGKNVVGCKWTYRTKFTSDGAIEKYKARLVAKGFSQEEGIDYTETFAPVAKMTSIRTIVALAAKFGWKIFQMDVKSAFLHGDLKEEIYMQQPPGFIKYGEEHLVCRLRKSLYGLKQAPREWYSKINKYFLDVGFKRSNADPDVYVKYSDDKVVIIVLYVDDLIITGDHTHDIEITKDQLKQVFEITDLGLMHYFLGMQVWQEKGRIMLSQTKYALDVLKKFNMSDCKPCDTPCEVGLKLSANSTQKKVDGKLYRQLVGNLLYLTITRPDIAYAVGIVSRYMADPHIEHWKATKRILRYIKGTYQLGIEYKYGGEPTLVGYTDSDYAGDIDDRKSTSRYIFHLGSGLISWSSKKQSTVSLSSTEAEYIGSSKASQEALWLRRLLEELHHPQDSPTTIFCDNQSAIKLAKNPVYHARSKHIEVHHHFVRDLIESQEVELQFCGTEDQVADVFTKALSIAKFTKLRDLLQLKYVSTLSE